jgi:hypothetical protein
MNARVLRLDPDVLERALERARAAQNHAVVIFDLDSTLLDNRPRQARILREFGHARGLKPLEEARPEHWTDWDIGHAMLRAGLGPAEVERIRDAAKDYWRERFFTSEYCALDEAIAGAPAYVRRVADAGAQVAYCTGRHEGMREGSVRAFERLGFPTPGARVHLLMKPELELSDDVWKGQAYARLKALGDVEAAFDNEPTHVNGYRRAFPDALCVHVATDDSGRDVTLLPGVVSISNFVS